MTTRPLKTMLARLSAAMLLALLAGAAPAQLIYRCGDSYSQTPCPGGRVLDSSDPRTAAQRAEAKRAAIKERQLAAKLERERLANEAVAAATPASGFDTAPKPEAAASQPAKPKAKGKPRPKPKERSARSDSGDFIALAPTPRPSRRD